MSLLSSVTNGANSVIDAAQDGVDSVIDTVQSGGLQIGANFAIDLLQDGLLAAAARCDGLFGTKEFREGAQLLNAEIQMHQNIMNFTLDNVRGAANPFVDDWQLGLRNLIDDAQYASTLPPKLIDDKFGDGKVNEPRSDSLFAS